MTIIRYVKIPTTKNVKIAEKYLKKPEKHLKSNFRIPEKKLEKYLKKVSEENA